MLICPRESCSVDKLVCGLQLMSDVASCCSQTTTEKVFVPLFLQACTDMLFQVRRVSLSVIVWCCAKICFSSTTLISKENYLDYAVWRCNKSAVLCHTAISQSCFFNMAKMTHSHCEVHNSAVQRCQLMSGNDCWKRYVFSRCWNMKRGEDWKWTGKEFQTMDAATGNERRPMVVRRYGGTSSWSVDDHCRRWRLGRSDTGWFKYACIIPCSTRYTISARLKLTHSWRRSQWSITRASVTWS